MRYCGSTGQSGLEGFIGRVACPGMGGGPASVLFVDGYMVDLRTLGCVTDS